MNPNYVFQLYDAQRGKSRAEIIAEDTRRGHQAAAIVTAYRTLSRRFRAAAGMIENPATSGVAAGSHAQ
jgi:hypothetical protein